MLQIDEPLMRIFEFARFDERRIKLRSDERIGKFLEELLQKARDHVDVRPSIRKKN